MSNLFQLIAVGGPVMIPIVGMSIATVGCGLERSWFWYQLLSREDRIVREVLEAAHYNLADAAAIARQAKELPIGRFLLAPLRLQDPTPETFRLALETAADREFIEMHRGDKLLESVVGIAPLLGLLGTVTGLIATFANLNIGGSGGAEEASKAAAGIGEALTTTAGGMIAAILALSILRILVTFQTKQMQYFSQVGAALELIYRQVWYEANRDDSNTNVSEAESDSNLNGINLRSEKTATTN
ncbi:MotA/TolQ/ExbB proton channel family protein [Limnothrix sp. FACHB-881]|uniref:MotA/TolQ/ExbB proton channel family protein n=1 Tax=Limnothrix sp. FACHB-881 TaxID=2692819 RepID=UPI0016857FBD|nr:MotA/TolQ/ExbB proton channel family protein [Limnothrix sp. FACHB-881]MBD2634825.1 MotA/TolQ/ExbB proton channel family protein [Limnothrix sp. FACHB-881]